MRIKNLIHKSATGFMAVWLSGFVFLFCCEMADASAMDTESCPLVKMSAHCDKAEQETAPTNFAEKTDEDRAECCAFLALVFDKHRKIEPAQEQSAITPRLAALNFGIPRIAAISTSMIGFRTRLVDKQSTFIRNRVLRI